VPSKIYLRHQMATILRFAKETKDPQIAAKLLAKAASLNEKLDDLPFEMDVSPRAPDVDPGKQA
jgi:hypothetical protein